MTLCYKTSSKKWHKGHFNVVATNSISIYLVILSPDQVGSGIRQIMSLVILA
jgi:hypothetical protein